MRAWILALWASLVPLVCQAQESRPITLGERASLRSTVLGEEREYWVYLPASYSDSTYAPERYPVLYLLDGEANFHGAAGTVHVMSSGRIGTVQIPEMIVVGILNTDRTRDFTPTHTTRRPQGEDPSLKTSGGADAFLRFLEAELMPHIERTYRTQSYRVIVGHSFGGLLALHAFVARPHLFQGYIAIDPSLFWDEQVVVRRAERASEGPGRQRTVYIGLSPAYSSGHSGEAVLKFAGLVEKRPDVRSSIQHFEREIHQSVGLVALYDGLLFLFEGFRLTPGQIFEEAAELTARFQQLSERFGIELRPPERFIDDVAHAILRANFADKAADLLQFNVGAHPTSFNAHRSLAQAYVKKGDVSLAIEHYETALQLNPKDEDSRRLLRALRRGQDGAAPE